MARTQGGLNLCYGDVYATWTQIAFGVVLILVLILTTLDLLTTCYTLHATEDFLMWLEGTNMALFLLIFVLFGAVSIVLLLPQTVLFLGAGYACAARIDNEFLAFSVGLCLSLITFVLGATVAFLLARKVLPPSCTRKFFKHFAILEGLDHALRHKGRRINILLRANPLAPYNALNYGLGLSSCTIRAYLEGMVGAIPYTCVAVYAGTVIASVEDIDSLFTYTSVMWYCIYGVFAVICIVTMIAIVRYTAAEMKAAVAAGSRESSSDSGFDENGVALDGQSEFEDLPHDGDSTMFGTFTSRTVGGEGNDGGGVGGEEEMTALDDGVVSTEPLLGAETHNANGYARDSSSRPSRGGTRRSAFIDV